MLYTGIEAIQKQLKPFVISLPGPENSRVEDAFVNREFAGTSRQINANRPIASLSAGEFAPPILLAQHRTLAHTWLAKQAQYRDTRECFKR